MISKICNRCRKQLSIGQKCNCTKKAKNSTYRSDDFYRSALWEQVRDQCINDCCGLDLYALFIQHRIEVGRTVHHIMPLEDFPELRFERTNLIYLSDANHRMIHSLYSDGELQETAMLLRSIKARFLCGEIPI